MDPPAIEHDSTPQGRCCVEMQSRARTGPDGADTDTGASRGGRAGLKLSRDWSSTNDLHRCTNALRNSKVAATSSKAGRANILISVLHRLRRL